MITRANPLNTKSIYRPVVTAQGPQAIILAAGRGVRLQNLHGGCPKCLLEIGGRSLLDHQLAILKSAGISDVCVVAGYRAEAIEAAVRNKVHIIENAIWDQTNSLYSLSLCREWVQGPLVVLNCDVLFHPQILDRILATPISSFAYDSSSGSQDEHMKVNLKDGCLTAMSKKMPQAHSHGENLGALHFSADAARRLFDEADAALARGGKNEWLAVAVEQVARRMPMLGFDIADLPWIEIDFPEDFTAASEHVWPAICAQAA